MSDILTCNVICMKWGTLYGAEYVNRLYGMVQRHLRLPHRFICFTDNTEGIRSEVEALPIPEIDQPSIPGRWRKQRVFVNPLYDLQGTALFLDLDVVIVGCLDDFFTYPGEFVMIKDWGRTQGIGNSSVFRFQVNQHSDLLEEFRKNWQSIHERFPNEQEYLTDFMRRKGVLSFWPAEWCVSFKRHCLPRFPRNLWQAPTFPPHSRIVVFHGHPKPHEALMAKRKNLFKQIYPAHWIADYWHE